jgi:Polyketide cyclase / dehydrase and lipid transport
MARSQWHKFYAVEITAPPGLLFGLLADLPNYGQWLPGSDDFGHTTDVEPYPVRCGSRYHDGKPGVAGKDWWGTVTGFQPPGSLDFQHAISVPQLRATIDVHIHYSLEPREGVTQVTRWLVLDIALPAVARPLRPLVTARFDKENRRTLAALKSHAEARPRE